MYKFFMRGHKEKQKKKTKQKKTKDKAKDKENEGKYGNNNKESSQIDSTSLPSPSIPVELDTSNLIVVGVIKADEHSRLTFTKRIKSVFPIFPGNTVVIYQDTISNDLIFKVQHDKVISDTWIVKKKKYDVEPFSNTNALKKVSDLKNKFQSKSLIKINYYIKPKNLPK